MNNESFCLNNLFVVNENDVFKYNIKTYLTRLNELREKFIDSCQTEQEKQDVKRNSVILLTEKMLTLEIENLSKTKQINSKILRKNCFDFLNTEIENNSEKGVKG